MKDYIVRLTKGEFEYNIPKLGSVDPIDSEIIEKTEFSGVFEIKATGKITGTAFSTDERLLTDAAFHGNKATVQYHVSALASDPGEEIKGSICVITSAGEIRVPFRFLVIRRKLSGEDYDIEDLKTFADFASRDEVQAAEIFKTHEFRIVVLRDDMHLNAVYDQLIENKDILFAMHSFLNAVGYGDSKIRSVNPDISQEYNDVSEDVRLEKKRNKNDHEIVFSVFVNEWNKIKIKIIRGYLDFRMKKISLEDWVGGSLRKISNADFISLYNFGAEEQTAYLELAISKALLLSLKGDGEEAVRILDSYKEHLLENKKGSGTLYYMSLYVRTISCGSGRELEKINKIFAEASDKENVPWAVLVFQYHLDQNSEENASIWLTRFKDAFNRGCTSPIVYLESIRIINREPLLLRVLNAFETQVIRFGYRYHLIEQEATSRFTEIVSDENNTDMMHLKCLKYLYDEYNSDEILSTLCSKMIQEHMIGPQHSAVYERAIKRQLKITKLYEFYLMSLYGTQPKRIPEIVLRYFAYDSMIDGNTKAFLYANVVKLREKEPEIFIQYRNSIVEFARDRLTNGYIDDNLIIIYRWMWTEPRLIDESLALQVFRLQHTYRMVFNDEGLENIIVRHMSFKGSRKISIKNKRTYAFVLSEGEDIHDECVICIEDDKGTIYPDNAFEYTIERVIEETMCLDMVNDRCVSDPFYNLYRYKLSKKENDARTQVMFAKNLLVYEGISEGFEKELRDVLYGSAQISFQNQTGPDAITIKSDAAKKSALEDELACMLFTKADSNMTAPVFSELYNLSQDGMVVDAYLAYQSFVYFAKEEQADEHVFEIILDRLLNGRKQLPVELAALLKHNATTVDNFSDEETELYSKVLSAFIKKNYIFSFFKDMNKDIKLPYYLGDKTIIEFRHEPDCEAWIDFSNGRDAGHRVKLNEMFCGIYTYPVTLFEGESVDYSIDVSDKNGNEIKTRGRISVDGKVRNADIAFAMLNKMSKDMKKSGEKSIEGRLERYVLNERLNKKLFKVL